MLREALFTVLLCCVGCLCRAQDNTLFTSYTSDDGLPISTITDVIQDKDGFIWIATPDGLARFDGYAFHTYKNNPQDTSSLNSSNAESFYLDSAGQLWILTFRGLCRYNSFTGRFTNVVTYDPKYVVATVNCIYGEDHNNIYASLVGYGLVVVNKTSLATTRISIPVETNLNAALMFCRGFFDDGKIWMCSSSLFAEHCLLVYDINKHTSEKIPLQLSHIINLNDSIAIGVGDSDIVVVNKKNYGHRSYPAARDNYNEVTKVCRLSDTEVLLCSYTAGLMYFNNVSGTISKRITALGGRDKTTLYARSAFRDRSGNLWVGTSTDGLKKIQYPFKKFKHYTSYSINKNVVWSIYADSQYVYVGNFNNGLDIFSRKDSFIRNLGIPDSMRSSVYAITPIRDNKLLLIGRYSALRKRNIPLTCDAASGKMKIGRPLDLLLPDSTYSSTTSRFLYTTRDGMLAGMGRYLVSLHNTDKDPTLDVLHTFPKQILICCHVDSNQFIWVGSYKGAWCNRHGVWDSLKIPAGTIVNSITHDSSGMAWLGTANGIYAVDTALYVRAHFDKGNGLIDEYVYGILYGNDGNIWFSHNKGISVYQPHTKTFRHFSKDDGLQSNEFNSSAFFKAPDGELFFGGINGTNSFFPEQVVSNPNIPEVVITNIRVLDKPYKTDSTCWHLRSIVLPYTENSISFEFAALEYTNSAKNLYTYMMEGLDKEWVPAGDKRFARYPALPPGNYVFKVRAANNDGLWNDKPTMIYIRIIPPFWMTSWFYVLCILALVSIVAYVVSAIQKQRLGKQLRAIELQHKIQLERERISRDLHDNVGTQLSIINNNLEWVTDDEDITTESEKKEKLVLIKHSAAEMISVLRETIWALKKDKISLEEFSDKLKVFVSAQLELYPRIKISFHDSNHIGAIILSANEALNLFRICQEAVANILKYAQATAIDISIHVANGKYEIEIADNGVGFDPGAMATTESYGLDNIRFRANEIGCDAYIRSIPGSGVSVTIIQK